MLKGFKNIIGMLIEYIFLWKYFKQKSKNLFYLKKILYYIAIYWLSLQRCEIKITILIHKIQIRIILVPNFL